MKHHFRELEANFNIIKSAPPKAINKVTKGERNVLKTTIEEWQALGELDHPHIIRITDVF